MTARSRGKKKCRPTQRPDFGRHVFVTIDGTGLSFLEGVHETLTSDLFHDVRHTLVDMWTPCPVTCRLARVSYHVSYRQRLYRVQDARREHASNTRQLLHTPPPHILFCVLWLLCEPARACMWECRIRVLHTIAAFR